MVLYKVHVFLNTGNIGKMLVTNEYN